MNFMRRCLDIASAHKWLTGSVLALLVAVFGIGGVYIGTQGQAQAAVRDYSSNSIINGGALNYEEMTHHYRSNTHGDVRDIMDHYWIKETPAAGDQVIQGHANNRGEIVTNDGRVVGRNASSIGREPIAHSHPIEIAGKTYYETTHVGGKAFANPNGTLAATIVLDANGSFKYAWVNACGNPIYTPEPYIAPPPKPEPEPEPKEIKVCEVESKKIIKIREDEFDKTKHSKNLKDCEEKYEKVCELATKNIITIKEGEFDETKHSKNLRDCDEVIIKVCDLETKTIIQINDDAFDNTKHSKDLKDCDEVIIKVCDLKTKSIVQINEDDFDSTKHSKDLKDCDEVIIKVCDLRTKSIVGINEDQFDSTKHSKNLEDCKKEPVKVCEIETKTWVEVPEDEINNPKYSTDPKDCEEEKVVEMPRELPQTGSGSLLSGGIGLTAITTAAYYYYMSRRSL